MRSKVLFLIYLIPIYAFVLNHSPPYTHSKLSLIARFDRDPKGNAPRRKRPQGFYGRENIPRPGQLAQLNIGDLRHIPQLMGPPSYPVRDSSIGSPDDAYPPQRGSPGWFRDSTGNSDIYLSEQDTPSHGTAYGDLQRSFQSQEPVTYSSPRPIDKSSERRQESLDAYNNGLDRMVKWHEGQSPWDNLDRRVYAISPSESHYLHAQHAPLNDPQLLSEVSPIRATFHDNRKSQVPTRHKPPHSKPPRHTTTFAKRGQHKPIERPRLIDVRRPRDDEGDQYYKVKRNTGLNVLIDGGSGPTSQTQSASDQFQMYEAALNSIQHNISQTIFPYLDQVLAGTNSSLAYNMAWSIWADLTAAPIYIATPFWNGMNCLDWIEEAWINQTNANATATHGANASILHANGTYANGTYNFALLEFQATSRVLLELYEYAWYSASSAANKTGLLKDLTILSGYLLPVNTSIESPGFREPVDIRKEDMSYFTIYNRTMNENTTIPELGY